VRSLLEAGADVDQPNPEGMTPLMIAIDNFRYDTARLLLDEGANPHAWDWYGRTALYVAVDMSTYARQAPPTASSETSATDVIGLLLEAGVNPSPQLNMHRPSRGGNIGRFTDDLLTTGATPLLRAAIGHDAPAVRLLLEHGAAVDLPNVMGVTPLMAAAGMGVSGRDRRFNPDELQARVIDVLEILLAAGADIDARVTDINSRTARIARPSTMTEREGQTALFGAVKFGWKNVVEFLLSKGADPNVADALGKTPLDGAMGRIGGRDNTVSEDIAALLQRESD
jgi:ankyrin repeat protein